MRAHPVRSTLLLTCAAVLALGGAVADDPADAAPRPGALGPFLVELPVRGLEPGHQARVEGLLRDAFGGHVIKPECGSGVLRFYFGDAPDAVLRLEELRAALAKAELVLEPARWTLRPQEVGLYVSAEAPVNVAKVQRLLADAGAKPLGLVLDGGATCVVVGLHDEVAHASLAAALRVAGVRITGLCWGHWKHGFGIEDEEHAHRHEVGARLTKSGGR